MRYEPHQEPQGNAMGPAEMIIGFIVCLFAVGFIVSLLFH